MQHEAAGFAPMLCSFTPPVHWRTQRAKMHVKPAGGGGSEGMTKDAFTNDDILTDEGQREQERITWVGLASNVGLSLAKGFIGMESGSHALIADAFHSASDLCGDIVALAALNFAKKPADDAS
jgi:Co/Zn/Cd efflux system component